MIISGGITILGSFVFHTEDIFAKQDGKIRKLVGGISGLDESVPDNQVIIVSSNIAKSYETKSSSFKSVDMKPQDKPIQFVRADTSMILDLPVARPKEEELSQDLIPAVRKLEENLAGCIFVIGNKILPDDQQLGKPLEIDKKKGGSQRAVKSQQESADSSELEDVQEIVSVQLLVTGEILLVVRLSPVTYILSLIRRRLSGLRLQPAVRGETEGCREALLQVLPRPGRHSSPG